MKNKLLKTLACFGGIFTIGSTIAITSTSCGCSAEEKINPLPENVYDIDETTHELKGFTSEFLANPSAYDMCDTMRIPTEVMGIASEAFYNHLFKITLIPKFIKKVTFAKGSMLTSLNNNSFQKSEFTQIDFSNCNNLISFTGVGCFTDSKLTSVKFPKNLKEIGAFAFCQCSSLTSITLPSGLETIEDNAFRLSSSLVSVKFPSSLTKIGSDVFCGCLLDNIEWNAWTGNTTLDATSFSNVPQKGTVKVINPTDDEHNSAKLLEYLKTNGGLPSTWNAA